MGRRSEDDRRQIDRWNKICGPKGRWKRFLIGKIVQKGVAFDDPVASPVTRQTLLHWAYEINEKDFEQYAKQVRTAPRSVMLIFMLQCLCVCLFVCMPPLCVYVDCVNYECFICAYTGTYSGLAASCKRAPTDFSPSIIHRFLCLSAVYSPLTNR